MNKKREQTLELLSRSSSAKPLKRALASLIDALFILVLIYGCFFGGFKILETTKDYNYTKEQIKYEADYYKDLIEETHLAYYENENNTKIRYENDFFAYINITRLLIYSNENDLSGVGWYEEVKLHDTTSSLPESLTELLNSNIENFEKIPVKEFVASSYENDDIAYFYTQYVPLHNENNNILDFSDYDPKGYFDKLFELTFPSEFTTYFKESKNKSTFPYVIEKSICKKIFYSSNYMNTDKSGDDNYNYLANGYYSLQENAEKKVINSKDYNSTHYTNYNLNYSKHGHLIVLTLVLSYLVGFLAYNLTTKLIFKEEMTLGRKFLKLGQINYKGGKVKVKDIIIRTVMDAIFYFPLTFIFLFLPPFNSNANSFLVTLVKIGSLEINLLIIYIVILVLVLINFICALLTHYKLTAVDMITKTSLKDLKHIDEEDFDERDEGAM